MKNIAIVVEGANDVGFIGSLLARKNFRCVRQITEVPDNWRQLFPVRFPFNGDELERVARFPEIYVSNHATIGILNSGGDSFLIAKMREAIEVIGIANFHSIAIFADADDQVPQVRFEEYCRQMEEMNSSAALDNEEGFPVSIPSQIGTFSSGNTAVGIFIFPDNRNSGSLENLLLECASDSHDSVTLNVVEFVDKIDKAHPTSHPSLRRFRAGSGRNKAKAGIISNIVRPGASLAVSISQGGWVTDKSLGRDTIKILVSFLDSLIGD